MAVWVAVLGGCVHCELCAVAMGSPRSGSASRSGALNACGEREAAATRKHGQCCVKRVKGDMAGTVCGTRDRRQCTGCVAMAEQTWRVTWLACDLDFVLHLAIPMADTNSPNTVGSVAVVTRGGSQGWLLPLGRMTVILDSTV